MHRNCTLLCLALSAPLWAAVEPLASFPIVLEKNLPLAQVRIGASEPVWFILDSAAAHCVIDSQVVKQLALAAVDQAITSGSGGSVQVPLLKNTPLDLGGLKILPDRTLAYDLSGLKFVHPVAGILGMPLFGNYVVDLDYPRQVARIYATKDYVPPPGAIRIPSRMTTAPTIAAVVELTGRQPYTIDVEVDTGSAHVLTLCSPFVRREKLLDAATELKTGRTLGIGGASPDSTGKIKALTIGPFRIADPEVRFSSSEKGSLATDVFQGNVGSGFLKDYRVIFDIPHNQMWLCR